MSSKMTHEQVVEAVNASSDGMGEGAEDIARVLLSPTGTRVYWLAEDGGWARICEVADDPSEGGYATVSIETEDGRNEPVPAFELSMTAPR